MIDGRLLVASLLLACAAPSAKADRAPANSPSGTSEASMNGEEITVGETTQPTISGQRVGVANIWERELPDDKGVVASRMAATVAITDPATGEERTLQVWAGSVIAIGADRYSVVNVDEGTRRGSITLRKVSE